MRLFPGILLSLMGVTLWGAGNFYGEAVQRDYIADKVHAEWLMLRQKAKDAEQNNRIFLDELRIKDPDRCQIIELRLKVIRNLLRYIEQQLANTKSEGELFARQGMFELKALLKYLDEEQERDKIFSKEPLPLNVKDFGAKGDGTTDDALAFRKVLEKAEQLQKINLDRPIKILIPAGRYRLSGQKKAARKMNIRDALRPGMPEIEAGDPNWPTGHIIIANQDNIILQGVGEVVLLPEDSTLTAITVAGSRNIVIDNLKIEFVNRPFTQGEIIAVDPVKKSVRWRLDPGYPAPDSPRFLNASQRIGSAYRRDGSFIWPASTIFFRDVKKIDNKEFIVEILDRGESRNVVQVVKPGDRLAIAARYDTAKSVNVVLSKFCDISNVRVLSSPGVVFGLWHSSAINFVRCRIASPENSNRLLVSGGDGFQAAQSLIGPAVIDCDFSGMLDDGIMVCARQTRIIAAKDGNRKVLVPGMPGRPGVRSGVMDPRTGQIKSEAVCIAMKLDANWGGGKRGTEFEFDRPLVIDTTMENAPGKILSHREMIPYYTGLKPFPKQPDALICLDHTNSGTVIAGNHLHNYRGGGVAIRGAANVLVQDNRIESVGYQAFAVGGLMTWGESFPSHNITFSGNQARDTNAGVLVHFNTFAGQADSHIIRGIQVDGNRFEGIRKTGMYLGSCRDILVNQNDFSSKHANEGICLGNTDGVVFSGNRLNFEKVPRKNNIVFSSLTGEIIIDGKKGVEQR